MAGHHAEAAQRIQEKFNFYLIGLAFTILGLSIQTSKFGSSVVPDCFELAGWVCLLVSGVTGLFRLEGDPVLHRRYHAMNILENQVDDLKGRDAGGERTVAVEGKTTPEPVREVIDRTEAAIADIATRATKDSKKLFRTYTVHKYSLVAGMVSLVIARGFVPLKGIFCALTR